MQYALFIGCTIPARLSHYDVSARLIFDELGIDVVDIRDFNCCGYPFRNYDHDSFVLSSARNLALAEKNGLDIITLCKCCYGNLKKVENILKNDSSLLNEVNDKLAADKLNFDGKIEVKHFLPVLFNEIGIEKIKEKINRPFRNLKIAAHYGCHALRPSSIVQFDDPNDPKIFDELVEATGAESIKWQNRLECCGAPMLGINDELSKDIMGKKIQNARDNSADYICAACSYCQVQLDQAQKLINNGNGKQNLPSILYTQLLGLAMGIEYDALQIDKNELDVLVDKYI